MNTSELLHINSLLHKRRDLKALLNKSSEGMWYVCGGSPFEYSNPYSLNKLPPILGPVLPDAIKGYCSAEVLKIESELIALGFSLGEDE